jgi:hypothetical protein
MLRTFAAVAGAAAMGVLVAPSVAISAGSASRVFDRTVVCRVFAYYHFTAFRGPPSC